MVYSKKLQNYKMTLSMCKIRHIKKKKKKKKNKGFAKNRGGRVSGNPTFFFLGLRRESCEYQ